MLSLVTGATGFLGGHLASALLARGDRVRALVRDSSRAGTLLQSGVELVEGDFTEPDSLRRAVDGVQRVFHAGGIVGDWLDRREAFRINVDGTRELLAASARARVTRFLHVSSLAVLGTRHHCQTDESAPYRYGDSYTDSKIDSERAVLDFARRGELEAVCLRPGFVYGPGDRQFLPKLIDAVTTGRFIYVGNREKHINSIYVADFVQAMLLADRSTANGKTYNLTDGAGTTLREFVTFLAGDLKIAPPSKRMPAAVALAACPVLELLARVTKAKTAPRLNRARLRFLYFDQDYSIEKARAELEYSPVFTYREGLPPTLKWFEAQLNGAW